MDGDNQFENMFIEKEIVAKDITVVVPYYRTNFTWLTECLDSIRKQTVTAAEVIIYDDHSETLYSSELYSGFTYKYLPKNLGLSGVMNLAIEACETEWILKLDSDDLFSPFLIQALLEALPSDASVISPALQAFSSKGYKSNHPEYITKEIARDMNTTWITNHTGCLLNVADLKSVGGYSDNRKGFAEDYELWVKLLLAGKTIRNLPEELVYYRTYPTQLHVKNGTVEGNEFLAAQQRKLFW